jgi:hypothetical protein
VDAATWILLGEMFLVGLGVGLISNTLGLGGGILMVPAFIEFVPGMDAHTAKGTSLFIIIFVATVNSWRLNIGAERVPRKLSAVIAGASVVTAFAAGYLTRYIDDTTLKALIAAVAALLGVRTFFLQPRAVREADVRERLGVGAGIGAAMGGISGLVGVGGGAILVPMALYTGITSNLRVVALSNMTMIWTALAAAAAHFINPRTTDLPGTIGQVSVGLAPVVFLGAMAAGPGGRWLNDRMPLAWRRALLGVVLLIIAGRLAWRASGLA